MPRKNIHVVFTHLSPIPQLFWGIFLLLHLHHLIHQRPKRSLMDHLAGAQILGGTCLSPKKAGIVFVIN